MRIVTILVALVLLLLGPFLYLGPGATARAERHLALAKLREQHAALEANLLTDGKPPSPKALAKLRQDLDQRRAGRAALVARLLAFRAGPAPSDVELRRAGEKARLAAPILEPLLSPMPDGAVGAARRQVLAALFRALEESATEGAATVSDLRLARETTPASEDSGLVVLHGQLVASGPPSGVALLVESILETRPDAPYSDLVRLDLTPDPEGGRTAKALPARVEFEFDVVVGESR